jgi:hypothetical protein
MTSKEDVERAPARPRKLAMHEDDQAELKAAGMDDKDIEMLTLMKVIKSAIEEQLSTRQPDGTYTCVIDASLIVDVHIRSTAYWLGMSQAFDDKDMLISVIAGIAARLLEETVQARAAFKDAMEKGGMPDNVEIIDSDMVSNVLN